jgi:hypothetical protein
MAMFRNMELVLMLGFGLVCAAAYVVRPPARVSAELIAQAPPAGPMPVVVIVGKRPGAADKRALASERRAG